MKKYSFLFVIFLCTFFSCSKKTEKIEITETVPQIEIKEKNHKWFYFSSDGYFETSSPKNAPFVLNSPWTEAIRISSANNSSSLNQKKGFAVVNRLGMITFDNEKINLSVDVNLFPNRTSGNLVFFNDIPVFSVFKSSFFNDSILQENYKNDDSLHLFLVQFDDDAKISYPLVNCSNLSQKTNSEVTDFYWNGDEWFCCIKSVEDGRVFFDYVKWTSALPLMSLSPAIASENLTVSEIDVSAFREKKQLLDYKNAPERIKKMLNGFDKNISFDLEVKTCGGSSPRVFSNEVQNYSGQTLKAKSIISQNWSCVIFEDGTLFIEGALENKHILRNGKPVAIRLPKLAPGFVYTDFVISGNYLYVGWEETDFYKVGKSGFIQVNLEKTLYNKMY